MKFLYINVELNLPHHLNYVDELPCKCILNFITAMITGITDKLGCSAQCSGSCRLIAHRTGKYETLECTNKHTHTQLYALVYVMLWWVIAADTPPARTCCQYEFALYTCLTCSHSECSTDVCIIAIDTIILYKRPWVKPDSVPLLLGINIT